MLSEIIIYNDYRNSFSIRVINVIFSRFFSETDKNEENNFQGHFYKLFIVYERLLFLLCYT